VLPPPRRYAFYSVMSMQVKKLSQVILPD